MTVSIFVGDCRDQLRTLADGSVAACVTSVPYWQKRDYGHTSQIGMEVRPEEMVAELVSAFAEVRRILIPGGPLWLNIADSYAAGGNGGGGTLALKRKNLRTVIGRRGWRKPPTGFKNKDLVLVSFMLAEALRNDGWWLRKTIVWSKPAASEPPRADRPSVSHEYLFLLSSSEDCTARDPGEGWWKSSVWEIPPSMGIGDHPAPMPGELARRCIVASSRPGETILDPFGGAGTTGLVADQLQRNAVLIELNPEYVEIARKRISADAGMFATEAA